MGCCLSSPASLASLRRSHSAAAALQQAVRPAGPSAVTPGAARCCRFALLPGLDARQACALLHVAAAAGHGDSLHELLGAAGVWPDSPDACTSQSGQTPLMRAAASPPPRQQAPGSVVQQLLDAGASVKRTDLSGWQALHHAAAAGHVAAIERLVAAGADPVARTLGERQTAYELAAAAGHREAAQLLLQLVKQRRRGGGERRSEGNRSNACDPPSPAEAAAIAAEMQAEEAEAAAAWAQQLANVASVVRQRAPQRCSVDGPSARTQLAWPAEPAATQTPSSELQVMTLGAAEEQAAAALAHGAKTASPQGLRPALRSDSLASGAAATQAAPALDLSAAAKAFLLHETSGGPNASTPGSIPGSDDADSANANPCSAAQPACTNVAGPAGACSGTASVSSAGRTKECSICFEAVAELLALFPCGHRTACEACTVRLLAHRQPCPICRAQVTGSARIFDV